MKKKLLLILFLIAGNLCFAQFNITVTTEGNKHIKEAYFYTIDGSKGILLSKENSKNNEWHLKVSDRYVGMLKMYIPEIATTIHFISENKDVKMHLLFEDHRIVQIVYKDDVNKVMQYVENREQKEKEVLPVLQQLIKFYESSSDFYKALEKEMYSISNSEKINLEKHPFIQFYIETKNKFLVPTKEQETISKDDFIHFFSNSDSRLETSNLMRPILIEFLNTSKNDLDKNIDELLSVVSIDSYRGQSLLTELIEIFETYDLQTQKQKYLQLAQGLTCDIDSRLESVIEVNMKTAIGSKFDNYTFVNPKNTKAKTLYDINANKKIIVFYSSNCYYCERDVPQLIPYYEQFKKQGIEVVAFSLDTDEKEYNKYISKYPWINDCEFQGWNSTYINSYNIKATPTYYILDKNNSIIGKYSRIVEVLSFLNIK